MFNRYLLYGMAFLTFVLLVWFSLFTGVKDIHWQDLFSDPDKLFVFGVSRIPRTLALILVGAGMSIAGFVMQQLSQNRFVSPTTSGSLDAAKLGILAAIILMPQASLLVKMLFAIAFTFFSSLIFIVFMEKVKLKHTVFIPLIGLMFAGIISSIATFFAYKHGIVQNTQEWLLGDFSSVMQGQYEVIYLILPAVMLIYVYADRFTIAGMGESFATNLGLSYRTTVYIGLFLVALLVSSTMVTVGAIPFLGLIVPNLLSIFFGDKLRRVLPIMAFVGAIFLMACDLIARLIVFPYEIPIGMIVAMIGGCMFLLLLFRRES